MADKIKVRLVRSPIGTDRRARETVKGLGLGRIGSERELSKSRAVEGMIRRVSYLVEVREHPDA